MSGGRYSLEMAYRTTYKGQEVICDTIQELDALLGTDTTSSSSGRKKTEKRTPRTAKGWAKAVAPEQRDFLKALACAHPNSLSDVQIKEKLGLDSSSGNRKIAGLMGGLNKAAKKSGLQFADLISKENTRNGNGERHYSYGIVPTVIAEVKQGLGLE
jgi:hypothetical protein